MELQLHPYSIPFTLSMLICVAIAALVWTKRAAPGAVILFVHLLGLAVWSAAEAAMWLSTSGLMQEFWLEFSSLGAAIVIGTFLPFALTVSLHEHLVRRRLFLLLGIEPLIGFVLLFTNNFHHLFFSQLQFWKRDGLFELRWDPGIWFWVDNAYTAVILGIGIWYLIRSIYQNGELHRRQTVLVLAGAFLPLVTCLIDVTLSGNLLYRPDLSPLVFTVSAVIYSRAMAGRKFLDILPVAHKTLIEHMTDGVMVLDAHNRIVEINSAAGQFLDVSPAEASGRPARELLAGWEPTAEPFWEQPQVRTEVIVSQANSRYIDLNITPLTNAKGLLTGRIFVFREITERKLAETDLQQQIHDISNQREELREQATRDPLTSLYNRRYLEEMLSQELARATRENYPVCVIMLDIDRFKRVNDACGHPAGDEVLQALANLIVVHIRRFDVACRYGGEEFVIVMPRLPSDTARERAEYIRREFVSMPKPCADVNIQPTLSIGIAVYPADGADVDQLLRAADQALYAAKGSGRNRTVMYDQIKKESQNLKKRNNISL